MSDDAVALRSHNAVSIQGHKDRLTIITAWESRQSERQRKRDMGDERLNPSIARPMLGKRLDSAAKRKQRCSCDEGFYHLCAIVARLSERSRSVHLDGEDWE